MVRFLLSASCLALLPAARAVNLFPSSPLVQIGNDTDIFFDSSLALRSEEHTSELQSH